jgi:hypothetical protein
LRKKSHGPEGPWDFFSLSFCKIPQGMPDITMIKEHDDLMIYCSQLGGEVPFRYCRTDNDGLPCRKILVCWEFRVEIARFLSEHYSLNQIRRALEPPTKTRIEMVLELIEKAKRIKEGGE